MTSEDVPRANSIALSDEDEKQFREFLSNIPKFNRVMGEFSRMMDEGQLDSLSQGLEAVRFLKDGLNDESVENMASSAGDILSTWRRYSSVLGSAETLTALDKVLRLERDGALDAVVDAAYILKFLRDGLNDEALTNISEIVSQMLSRWHTTQHLLGMVSSPAVTRVLGTLTDENVMERLESAPPRKGGMSLLSMSDPDVRKGMGVLFEMLKIIGEEFGGDGKK